MYQFRYLDAFPTLAVGDLERAERWYRDVLGFGLVLSARSDGLLHLRRSGGQDVILRRAASLSPGSNGAAPVELYFASDRSLEPLAGRVGRANPAALAWHQASDGASELHVTDPDGHRLVFFERSRH